MTPHPTVPDGACDCHVHIYNPAQGAAEDGSGWVMPWATLDAYHGVQARLGLRRAVIVQPNAYGTDNTTTLEAVAALGADACGVAIVTPATPEDELARLHRGGIRGARCHMLGTPLLSWNAVEVVAARVAPLGWHMQVQFDGRLLPEHDMLLRRLPCPVVIDHIGKFLEPVPPGHEAAQGLLRLLETGRHWLKLAAPYEVSRAGGPNYADVSPIAVAAIRAAPERVVWASNWPHVGVDVPPDDQALLNLLSAWSGDQVLSQRILVTNPATLYAFA